MKGSSNTAVPEYMVRSGERVKHPFLMYDNIMMTPRLLSECAEGPVFDATRTLASELHRRGVERIYFTGCGTSLFVGKQLALASEVLAGIPAHAENPYELVHYPPVELDSAAALIVVSHSGRTKADREAIDMARSQGAYVASFTDNPDAPILAVSDSAVVGPGGPDHAIPKTRSYTTALYRGLVLVGLLAQMRNRPAPLEELKALPGQAKTVLEECESTIRTLGDSWSDVEKYFGVGSGPNVWTGTEAVLKMMETAGLVGQGFELEEYTHGPELSLDERSGVLLFQGDRDTLPRALTAVRASIAGGAKAAVITSLPEAEWGGEVSVIPVPKVPVTLSPILMILPAQLLVYHTALRLGRRPDVAGTDDARIRAAGPRIGRIGLALLPPGGLRVWGVPVAFGMAALSVQEGQSVEAVEVAPIDPVGGVQPHRSQSIQVDLVCLAGGLTPLAELAGICGCEFTFIPELGGHVPLHGPEQETTVPGLYVAGNITGVESALAAAQQGRIAGLSIARDLGYLTSEKAGFVIAQVRNRLERLRCTSGVALNPSLLSGRAAMSPGNGPTGH